jgi:polyisoprenoid-binding protein YceI
MKKTTLLMSLFVMLVAFAFTTATVDFKIDKQKSKLTWVGKKVTGEHTGNIKISDGKFTTNGKTVTGGSFDIDMNSITCTDLTDAGYNEKLVGHLKADDFFGTDKYPKSTFVISKITNTAKDQYNVKGNLTIKGITKEVEFPATIQVVGNQVKAKAKIVVDRTKYEIKYGSVSFFDGLGDKAISDEFELNVDLVANK